MVYESALNKSLAVNQFLFALNKAQQEHIETFMSLIVLQEKGRKILEKRLEDCSIKIRELEEQLGVATARNKSTEPPLKEIAGMPRQAFLLIAHCFDVVQVCEVFPCSATWT